MAKLCDVSKILTALFLLDSFTWRSAMYVSRQLLFLKVNASDCGELNSLEGV